MDAMGFAPLETPLLKKTNLFGLEPRFAWKPNTNPYEAKFHIGLQLCTRNEISTQTYVSSFFGSGAVYRVDRTHCVHTYILLILNFT